MRLTVTHDFLPKTPSTRSAEVMGHFGIDFEQGAHVIAQDVELPIAAGQLVLLTGESGAGKSSLMRQIARQCENAGEQVVSLDDVEWTNRVLIDLLPLPVSESLALLSSCGLGEAHLVLRTPAELSDGQRYRFRLALALSQKPDWVVADEFTATLDRKLAQLVAANIRRRCDREQTGFLLATTHDDLLEALQPDLHIHCRLDGTISCDGPAGRGQPRKKKRRLLPFERELWISPATKSDWTYFARWHYRSHNVGLIRFMTTLWHGEEPIGICLFIAPPKSLSQRNRYFGHSGRWNRASLRVLNSQLVMLSRVVLHPTYRGCGLATRFIRRSCELCPFPWIETLTQMGHFHPFFERAGFVRVGTSPTVSRSRASHSVLYRRRPKHGEKSRLLSQETYEKSRYANPVYYIFDNRASAECFRRAAGTSDE